MFSRVKGFINRHKRKFFVTGIVIGGGVLLTRYVQKKIIEYQEKQTKEFIERTKRIQHFESTERTCNQAIIGLSPSLCDEIKKALNTEEILQKLKENPENKVQLWDELKVLAFSKLATLIYASSILVITLRVQINLLGGYLYKDTVSEEAKITDDIRQNYLSLIQYFLKDGLIELVELIKQKVHKIMKTYELNQKLSLADVEQIFWSIQMAVNSDIKDPNSKISEYVLPKEIQEAGLFEIMFNETLDMLESDDVAIICSDNVSRGFSIAVESIAEYYTDKNNLNGVVKEHSNMHNNRPGTSKTFLNEAHNINVIALYLAKLIPVISGITSFNFNSNIKPQNLATSLVTLFLVSEKIKTLGTNVYETFCV